MSDVTRRAWIAGLSALAAASKLPAQPPRPPIPARKLSQMTLTVTNLQRSLDFYQGLFGMPVQARQGSVVLLRVGPGPQYLGLQQGAKAGFHHYGIAVNGFDAGRVAKILADRGVEETKGDPGPMQFQLRQRSGTAELFFGDPDGIVVQLQDTGYCGGSGALGNVCGPIEAAPRPGLLALRDLSHFTIFGANAAKSQIFYQDVFGLFVQAHQGEVAPVFGVGAGPQFLMLAAGPGRGGSPVGSINHGCFSMEGFNPDAVLKSLDGYGLKARGTSPAGPLQHYVTMRMENRGGAPGGTPELYFTDPDGILLQLQDVSYCGGAGKLGEICAG
jgi:catechol 2,3-dioxygenase-like lactoylglutathione lyase family enzyme